MTLVPHRSYTQSVVISAGIHGNETAPIEILNQLVTDLLAGQLPLSVRLLVLLGNPPAIRKGKRYLSNDINRMFGGRYQHYTPSDETRRASTLEQRVMAFSRQVTHQSVCIMITHRNSGVLSSSLWFVTLPADPLFRCYVSLVAGHRTGCFGYAHLRRREFAHFSSERCQAASCTLELGKALPFGENQLSQFSAITQGLRSLVSDSALPARKTENMKYYRVVKSLLRQHPDFKLRVAEDTVNFTRFAQGTLLTEQPNDNYRVEHPYEWILFPNPHVALGLRAGMMLVKCVKVNYRLHELVGGQYRCGRFSGVIPIQIVIINLISNELS